MLVDLIGSPTLDGNTPVVDSGLLSPIGGVLPAVPEPGTSLLMAAGGTILLTLGRFRRRS